MTLSTWCAVMLLVARPLYAEWETVAPGVQYQRFYEGSMDIHVTRVDLTRDDLRIVTTRESDRGTRVSEFARRNKAIVAINADYFDELMKPVGLSIGPCGPWKDTKDNERWAVAAFGRKRATFYDEADVMDVPYPWITAAVSGWPVLIKDCDARDAHDLPGSRSFTHSPHPRTAVGVTRDRSRLFFVVAEGRRERVPGLTLPELASWMRDELRICHALNLDGGGSSAMWVKDRIVNIPSDGSERKVADHIAVIHADDDVGCAAEGKSDPAPTAAKSSLH